MNQKYFVIKAIKEAKSGVVTAEKLMTKYGIANPSAVVSELRKRGHEIIATAKGYALPFGTRDEAAKLSKTARKQIAKEFGLA